MTNPNRMNDSNRVNGPNSVDSFNGRPVDSREVANRDGYVRGRQSEQLAQLERERVNEEYRRANDSENAFNGLILGVLLASGVGLAVAAFSLWYREQNPVQVAPPAPASPVQVSPAPASPPTVRQERTIIERNTDRVISPAPASPDVNVNITNPAPAPGTTQAPGTTVNPAPSQPTTVSPTNPGPGTSGTGTTTAPNQTAPAAPGTGTSGQ